MKRNLLIEQQATIDGRLPFVVLCFLLVGTLLAGCQSPITRTAETVRFQGPGHPTGPYDQLSPLKQTPSYEQTERSVDDFVNGNYASGDEQRTTRRRPDPSQTVLDVKIKGNRTIPDHEVMRVIRTRPGRLFDPDLLKQDVDDLWKHKRIRRIIGPYIDKTPQGVVVTIEVVEGRYINEVKYIGNRGITDRTLARQIDLKKNQPLDTHRVRMARQRLEEYYKENGYPRTQVSIIEGDQLEDNNVVFLIHEDNQQKIWSVDFVGNEFAWTGRLNTVIKSKPGILKVFGGTVNRQEIEQDVLRITSYYRSLGFFNAKVGREIEESDSGWVNIKYIIHEGPRYIVRNVSFMGNEKFTNDQLYDLLTLKPGDQKSSEFNAAKMQVDVQTLKNAYGSQGHVFANVVAEPRFLEEPGTLDMVYKIEEGKQYRVGKINVHISGDYGITKKEVVLNRLSLRPGDIIDTRKLERSKVRLRGSSLFAGGPSSPGPPPNIVVKPPELKKLEQFAGGDDSTSSYRGQSPN